MLPDIHRATQKFYIFLIVYLTGCTPLYDLMVSLFPGRHRGFAAHHQKVENIRFDTHIVLKNPYTLAEYCQKYFVLRPALRWKV